MITLALLFGGPSVEHEVSLRSTRAVLAHVDRKAFMPILLGMTREGQWVGGEDGQAMLEGRDFKVSSHSLAQWLKAYEVDVVFPLIHGTYGEDGVLQGYLEALDIPFIGAGSKASAVGMDKAFQKALWAQKGLPIVPYRVIYRENPAISLKELSRTFNLPIFVKPADLGSSVGITRVTSWDALEKAIQQAFLFSRKVLIEQGIEGRELEVAILGSYQPEVISFPGEIIPGRTFYDYEDKYLSDGAKILVPADLPSPMAKQCQVLAGEAYQALDMFGMARVDFFLDKQENLYINEINTIPGFTSISMYPKLMEYMGISFTKLISRLVALAQARKRLDQKRLQPF